MNRKIEAKSHLAPIEATLEWSGEGGNEHLPRKGDRHMKVYQILCNEDHTPLEDYDFVLEEEAQEYLDKNYPDEGYVNSWIPEEDAGLTIVLNGVVIWEGCYDELEYPFWEDPGYQPKGKSLLKKYILSVFVDAECEEDARKILSKKTKKEILETLQLTSIAF